MGNEVSLDHWTTLFLLASVQGFFLSAILFLHKKGNVKATRILATDVLLFSVMLLYYVLYWTGYANAHLWVNGWVEPINFLYGPLTYFYLRELQENSKGKRAWLHFIPAVAHVLYMFPVLLHNVLGIRILFGIHLANILLSVPNIFLIWAWLANVSLIAYGVIMLLYLRRDKKQMTTPLVKDELLKHAWLKKIVWFYSGFAIAAVSYYVLAAVHLLKLEYDYMISVAMSAFIYMVGYLGFRQPEIFHGYFSTNGNKNGQKYAKSSLKDEQVKALLTKLTEIMELEKPYLDSELKIQQLATRLEISTHNLSQLINEHLHQSYADFINTYRVNEARRLLLSPSYEKEKILSVAFDCGFHNKATFNTAFKKYAGMSPSDYKRLHQNVMMN